MTTPDVRELSEIIKSATKILINVEVVPPDRKNTLRAIRLNPPQALTEWLAFIAEP